MVLMNEYLRMNIKLSFHPVTSFECRVTSQYVGNIILVKRSYMIYGVAAIVIFLPSQARKPQFIILILDHVAQFIKHNANQQRVNCRDLF